MHRARRSCLTRAPFFLAAALAALGCAVDPPPDEGPSSLLDRVHELRRQVRLQEAAELLRGALDEEGAENDPARRVRLTVELGEVLFRHNLHHNTVVSAELQALLDANLETAVASGDARLAGEAHRILARYHYRRELREDREFPVASEHAERALHFFTASGNVFGQAQAVHRQGLIAFQQRRLEEARRLFDEATELYRSTPRNPQLEADLHRHTGFVDLVSGDSTAAIGHFRQSFELRQEAGFRDEIMFSAITLGSALFDAGEVEEAVPLLEEADRIADEVDSPLGLIRTAFYLGQAREEEGNACGARQLYERSLEIATAIGYESFVGAATGALDAVACDESTPSPQPSP